MQVLSVIFSSVCGQNEVAVPLSAEDWQQIRNLSPDVASVMARQNAFDHNIAGRCRLIHECKRCVSQPRVIIDDVYDDACDKMTHVKNCRLKSRHVDFEKGVKICHHSTEKICETPCFNCPEFCQPNKQFWCEDDFEVIQILWAGTERQNESAENARHDSAKKCPP